MGWDSYRAVGELGCDHTPRRRYRPHFMERQASSKFVGYQDSAPVPLITVAKP
jgi:hypothetical protein